jgi:flagellar biosynthesis protein FlhB
MKPNIVKTALLKLFIGSIVLYICISPIFEEYFELTENTINQAIKTNIELDIFIRFWVIFFGVILYRKLNILWTRKIANRDSPKHHI